MLSRPKCVNSTVTAPSPTIHYIVTMSHIFKWHVSPRFINTMQQIVNFKKYVAKSISNSPELNHLNSIYTQYVHDKVKTHMSGNESNTHSTGVTGLHSCLRRSYNPVTQFGVFHTHAHTHAFILAVLPHTFLFNHYDICPLDLVVE